MKKISQWLGMNFDVRFRNPFFWIPIIATAVLPVMAYTQTNVTDLTSWGVVGKLIATLFTNPYLLGTFLFGVYGALKNFDTKGAWRDSNFNMEKEKPTSPHMDLVIKGDDVVDDNSKVEVDNTEKSADGKPEKIEDGGEDIDESIYGGPMYHGEKRKNEI